MAREVNLDELIPDDLVFTYRGESYTIPGDIDTETVLRMYRLFQLLLETSRLLRDSEDEASRKRIGTRLDKASAEVDAILLELFQIQQPQMTKLPFGAAAKPHVIGGVLELLGVTADPQMGASSESTTSPPKSETRSVPRKRTSTKARSRQSSGSRSS